jgi:Tfp pilus assembly protein PilE
MGQQQLLLIILGVIIVGIAVAVGITMFQDNSVSSNRDAMANDLMHLAAKAKHYYKRPTSMGGGSYSFAGLSGISGMAKLVTPQFSNNSNATYTISVDGDADGITFRGVGKVAMDETGTKFPIVDCVVTKGGQSITVIQ